MPMPQTEQLELRTDTVEQLIELLETGANGGVYADVGLNRDRAKAIADRLREQTSSPDAIALCGLPGAGKSYTADKIGTVYGAPVVSMGDAIRDEAPPNLSSENLGEYAADWRRQNPEGIPEKVAEMAKQKYRQEDADLIIIDGVRSPTDYDVLSDYFDDFYLIEVQTDFYERLTRIQERGREGEDKFTAVDLAERDENERNNLGFGALCDGDYIDITIKNGTGANKLAISLSSVVEENLPFEIEDGQPLGLDEALEGYRNGTLTAEEAREQAVGGPVSQ